ncbi:hypothetical protein MAPG_01127 [Magnaporthiopsis poae ATCC 64411]|uniref:CFEM domain-containing protein n=1 Tax=Magnaporthiopsis poae (strain ATCC 64411 / 73-15) TaxID=644358 RepID=A0A0C4DMW2_MAGP6|nr:hypothetical protein MAPG_01127 [Magnaporthiopsis poae ATCC 64411]
MASSLFDGASLPEAVSNMPACAMPCAMRGMEASTCQITNVTCYCQENGFTNYVQTCVVKACKPKDLLALRRVLSAVCPRQRQAHSQRLYTDVIWTGLAVSTIFVFIRLWAKAYMSPSPSTTGLCRSSRMGALWWDDLCIFLSLLALGAEAVVGVIVIAPLHGQDMWSLQDHDLSSFFFWEAVLLMPLYFLQATLIRASFIFFFMRVFATPTTVNGSAFVGMKFRALLLGTHVTNALAGIALTWIFLGQCQPVSYTWTKWESDGPGTCALDPLTLFTVMAAVSIVLDAWLPFLPLSKLPRLKASLGVKVGVAVMFCLGGIAAMVNLGRLVLLGGPGRVRAAKGMGAGYSYYGAALWTELETVSGIVCSCLPAVRVFALWMRSRARRLVCNKGEGEAGSAAAVDLPRSWGCCGGRNKSGTGSLPSTSSRTGLVQPGHELSDIPTAWREDPVKREGNGSFGESHSADGEGTARFVVRKQADGKWRIARDV